VDSDLRMGPFPVYGQPPLLRESLRPVTWSRIIANFVRMENQFELLNALVDAIHDAVTQYVGEADMWVRCRSCLCR
jgi:hypothetical protein